VQRSRPRLTQVDRAFWVALSRIWPRWKEVLCIVQPETVVRWHRRGFRLYWRPISQPGPGRPRISPEETSTRFLIHDNDAIFSDRVTEAIDQLGIEPKRTAYRSPWQNGIAERWVGTVRRELLDHVIVLDEQHLRRLLREYVEYYNGERVQTRSLRSPVRKPEASIANTPRNRGVFSADARARAASLQLRRQNGGADSLERTRLWGGTPDRQGKYREIRAFAGSLWDLPAANGPD